MTDAAEVAPQSPAVGAPAPAPPVAAVGRFRRSARLLTAPFRFAARRPGRAALLAGCALLLAAGGVFAGCLIWFDLHLRAARDDVERWHNNDAIRHLSACRTLRPDHPDVLLLSSRLARRAGEEEASGQLLDRYVAVHGEDERWSFERVLDNASRGELESVTPALTAYIREGGPAARRAREAMVLGLTSRLQWQAARGVLNGWLSDTPDDPVALLLMGKVTENDRSDELAVPVYQRVLELDPGLLDAHLRLAVIRISQRRADDALPHLTVLRQRLPEHPDVRMSWVRALALMGHPAEARAALDACLAANPDFGPALAERGNFALLDGDTRAAEEYLGRAVRIDPASPATRNQYALALDRNGKTAEAAREYTSMATLRADTDRIQELVNGRLRSNPNDPGAYHEIGMIALRSGQLKEGLRWLKSALRVDPNHAPTHQTLAALYREMGDPVLASKHRALAQRAAGAPTH